MYIDTIYIYLPTWFTHNTHPNTDYAIYDSHLVVVDPSGFTLHGLESYKNAFRLVHLIVELFYCKERSLLTFRLVYDVTRTNIRVSWNAEMTPRFGRNHLYVDGISVYDLDVNTGAIVQHKVEHLLINDIPVETRDGIFNALKTMGDGRCTIPALNTVSELGASTRSSDNNIVMKFQPFTSRLRTSLFAQDSTTSLALSNESANTEDLDWEAYESKNKSRQKFGLKKLSPEEFLDLERQIQQMEVIERSKYVTQDAVPTPKPKQNLVSKLFGGILQDTCESNFDCKRPELCCDFGFIKKCCSSGSMVGSMEPVRVIADQQLPPDELYGRQREKRY